MRPSVRLLSSLPAAAPPRHLTSIQDLSATELATLVRRAAKHKHAIKAAGGAVPASLAAGLSGRTVAMLFSKRSTRTRVSTEAAVTMLGGHSMFLGKDDIQLGVNESLRDTATVISSMTSCLVARVGAHSEILSLAQYSSVPIINALSATAHPLQTIADLLTLHETLAEDSAPKQSTSDLGLAGLKLAWIGDANNVLFDLATGCLKLGIDVSVAAPPNFSIPSSIRADILHSVSASPTPGTLTETSVPEEALRDADVVVTDTWISMGQEEESQRRVKAFEGYQVTEALARRGGAKPNWKFMHCLPRHQEEVDDEVFYGPRSLVFPEAENRLWAALAALEAFVVNKGKIVDA